MLVMGKDYQWVPRANAYLDWLAEIEQEAEERLARQDAEMWGRRARERRERKWAKSEKWLEISDRTDQLPPVEQKHVAEKYEDGRPHITNVLKPLKRDSIRYGQAGFALGDEVIREATASSQIKAIQNEGGADEIEVQNVIDDEDVVPYKSAGKRPRSKSRS